MDLLLLSLGRQFDELDEMLIAQDNNSLVDEQQRERLHNSWWKVIQTASNQIARTAEGRAVKARMLTAVVRVTSPEPSTFQDLALSIARDLSEGQSLERLGDSGAA